MNAVPLERINLSYIPYRGSGRGTGVDCFMWHGHGMFIMVGSLWKGGGMRIFGAGGLCLIQLTLGTPGSFFVVGFRGAWYLHLSLLEVWRWRW
jgi:hypothetical protein